ncbi:16S rRNA (uracil(1498)-N(3))-methyltransferase [Demequina sp. TTPB684]|uniref:16S rRNA (uracil(1498)-N(3))-methyltransferase n=1 Tax=unclassified Demequina TaxID=2620311 RepID=UPI001CF488B4|nr:16S rRNA (uracil(1498)-N(3))-methyltransferase [Demequina sp. TMPB413]MCB2413314.1 16S rRNA (uracil(1498)-N(3))-methyltransferase [Demequina sp. TTPB684]UPU88967.1 16S rRNA (uracil(1498)-N(3))-methyltransferase [Demequina sp. TMPB413]
MSAPVFLSPEVADAAVGDVVALRGAEARHAGTVQRRGVGERVDVVDGKGRRATGVITQVTTDRIDVAIDFVAVDRDPPVTLVQALAKGGRDEQAVESATELGVTRIVPWAAARSIVQWKGPKVDKGRAAWESLALAATKQSRRALVPEVAPLVTTAQLVRDVESAVATGQRVLVLHEVAATALTSLTWARDDQEVWVIVGPEGGISDAEVEALTAVGAESVVLGPHVLRASSAGPAALAALAVLRGTWSSSPSSNTLDS